MTVLGPLGAVALMVLPGGWIAFGRRSACLGFWPRAAIAVVLSPFVVFLQYSVLRMTGASFDATAVLIAVLNMPVAWLLWKQRPAMARPDTRPLLVWLASLSGPVAFLFFWFHDPDVRAKWGHTWTHTDIIYMLVNRVGHPEEPQLAGVRLAYPWGVNAFQGVVSDLFGSAPNWNYLWTNLVWLAAVVIIVARIVRELGGNDVARATAVIWLCFAVNAVGYAGRKLLPGPFRGAYPVFGDNRYTPWLRKFGLFEGSALGVALVTAMALMVIQPWTRENRGERLLLVGMLLAAMGIMYPLMFPTVLILVAARLAIGIAVAGRESGGRDAVEVFGTAGVVAAAAVACALFVRLVTVDRAAGPALGLSPFWNMKVKAVESVIVLSPLLAGLAIWASRFERTVFRPVAVLILGGLGCIAAYVVIDVYHIANEYKFILAAAMCFTPFAAMGFASLQKRLGRGFPLAFTSIAALMALPGFLQINGDLRATRFKAGMRVDVGSFSFRLDDGESHAAVTDAIRLHAPADAVLLAGPDSIDYTALTRRATYVPFEPNMLFGTGIPADGLLKSLRGYDRALVDHRRTLLEAVYRSEQDSERSEAFGQIQVELRRPLVIMVDVVREPRLVSWLEAHPEATRIHDEPRLQAWVILPDATRGNVLLQEHPAALRGQT